MDLFNSSNVVFPFGQCVFLDSGVHWGVALCVVLKFDSIDYCVFLFQHCAVFIIRDLHTICDEGRQYAQELFHVLKYYFLDAQNT